MGRRIRIGMTMHGTGGKVTGVGRYAARMLAGAPDSAGLLVYGMESQRSELDPQRRAGWISGGGWHGRPWLDQLWHHLVLPLLAWTHRLDVLFVPLERRCPLLAPCPVVSTVHDLAPLTVAGKYGAASRLLFRSVLPRVLRRHRLIAVSRTTARDLLRWYPVQARRVRVVRNGVDPLPPPGPVPEWIAALPRPFVLYPARLEHPGKNHVLAIRALAEVLRRPGMECDLVCPGAPWQAVEAIHAVVKDAGLASRVHFPGWISDGDLAVLFDRARALIFPSRYEGFGLPLVEAMARGLPIVAAPCGAVPEVAGDAAVYAGPDDVQGFADAMIRVMTDEDLRERLRAAGLRRASGLQWSSAVRRTWRLICAAVGR